MCMFKILVIEIGILYVYYYIVIKWVNKKLLFISVISFNCNVKNVM